MRQNRSLHFLGDRIHDPNLWHLNRRSVSGAVFVGIYTAFMPIPFQMVVAAILAMALNVNLPLSVCLVWISNPLTYAPIFYFAYKLGSVILNQPTNGFYIELSLDWLTEGLLNFWQPLLTGSVIAGLFFGLLGFGIIRIYWRIAITKKWQLRRTLRNIKNSN